MPILKPINSFAKALWLPLVLLVSACQSAKKLPVAIESKELQVVYVGLPNPIEYVYNGLRCEDLIMVCDKQKASIKKGESCAFSITPHGAWKDGITVSIYHKKIDPSRLLEVRNLRVVDVPVPTVSLNGNTGPSISIGALRAVKIVSCTLRGFVFEGYRYRISAFDYLLIRASNKTVIDRGHVEGHVIPGKVREIFNRLEKGDMIHFYNLEARATDGSTVLIQKDLSLWIH